MRWYVVCLGVDDGIRVLLVLGPRREVVGHRDAGDHHGEHDEAAHAHADHALAELRREQPRAPQRDAGIRATHRERRPHEPELGHEHERKHQRRGERADVIERQHARDQILEGDLAFEQPHQDRQLEADEHADRRDEREQHHLKVHDGAEAQEQDRRRQPADDRDRELDLQEAPRELAVELARQPRADAHRRQVQADHERELRDRIAEQIAAERAGEQLVDEPADRDDEDVEIQRRRRDGRVSCRWCRRWRRR